MTCEVPAWWLVAALVVALPGCHPPSNAAGSEPSGAPAVSRAQPPTHGGGGGRRATGRAGMAPATPRGSSTSSGSTARTWSFEETAPGQVPAGWRVEATRRRGALATWQVIEDRSAPSGAHVLGMTDPNHTSGGTFNICWTDAVSFLDGEIEVRFKAVSGEEDQGGGVLWRAHDRKNYYIARFNPLENNFRIYSVRDGARRTLQDVSVALTAGEWHTLGIVQRGDHFEGHLDGRMLLEGTDDLLEDPGGVGLWTKADAVTSFDDFSVRPSMR